MADENGQDPPSGGDSPPPPESPQMPESPADPPKAADASGSVSVENANEGNIIAGVIQTEGVYSVTIDEYFAQGDGGGGSAKLRFQDFLSVSWVDLEKSTENTFCDLQEMELIVEALRRQRILLLEGAPEIGKRHLALKLAALLGSQIEIEQVQRLRSPVARNVRVDFERLLAKGKFEGSVILLENAFHYQNGDLTSIAKDTDATGRDTLESALRQSRTWMILTYDEDRCPDLHPSLQERRKKISGPKVEQLKLFLRSCALGKLVQGSKPADEERRAALESLLESHSETIVRALGTAPRILRFVVDHLTEALEDQGWDLSKALAHSASLDKWLIEDIGTDLNALAYVLALAVGHTSPDRQPLRWFQFDVMRRSLLEFLRRELGGEQTEPRSPRELCTEPELLRRLQVEIVSDPDGDVIRFIDDGRAERIWTTLLGKGRQLTGLLVPWLEEMAAADMYLLRRRAGWALGYLSQIDHAGIFRRLLSIWSRRSTKPQDPYVAAFGALVHSAYLSHDGDLKSSVIIWVRGLLRGSVLQEIKSGLLCLRDLGRADLKVAVAEIRQVAQGWLLPCLEALAEDDLTWKRRERMAQEATGSYRLRRKLREEHQAEFEKLLYSDMDKLFPLKREFLILLTAQYSLVGLCLDQGTTAVLTELRLWFSVKNGELAPLVALMFLRPNGLAAAVDRFSLTSGEDDDDEIRASPFLVSLAIENQGPEILAEFLFEAYLGACQLPATFKRGLILQWMTLLEGWTREAAKTKDLREPVMELWRRLLRAPDLELRDKLTDLLVHPEFCVPGTRLGEMVQEIGQRRAQKGMSRSFVP